MKREVSNFFGPKGAAMTSLRQDWRTPPDLFAALNAEFGFTLDAAANAVNHLCERYYTAENSAFGHSWAGETVFCNPPYDRNAAKWIEKFDAEARGGATVVALLPARTETRAFHRFIYNKPGVEVRFLPGRLRFLDPETGKRGSSAPFPSMVVVWKSRAPHETP